MRHMLYAIAIMVCATTAGWGSSCFGVELANNVTQDTAFTILDSHKFSVTH